MSKPEKKSEKTIWKTRKQSLPSVDRIDYKCAMCYKSLEHFYIVTLNPWKADS